MKLKSFILPVVAVAAVMSSCCQPKTAAVEFPENLVAEVDSLAPINTLTDAEKAAGWELLFDGVNTENFHGYNMDTFPDCWSVNEGILTPVTTGLGESQDIVTKKVYKDFAFAVQYKIPPMGNSGILFQVKEDSIYTFAYETGPEFQIIDHEAWPDPLGEKQKNGTNYEMYESLDKNYKPIGDWNQAVLIVKGNNVWQYLNGTLRAKYEKYSDDWTALRNSGKWANFPDYGKFDEGHISLQNHGAQVTFRNVKIKELK